MECRTESEIVDLGELVVDTLDEVVLDGGDRQCARRCIARDVVLGLPLE
jgi:hypothetical protein